MDKLHYALDRFCGSTHIPLHLYTKEEGALLYRSGFADAADPLYTDGALLAALLQYLADGENPSLYYEENVFAYSLMEDAAGRVAVLGPVCLFAFGPETVAGYRRRHHLPKGFQLPVSDLTTFSNASALLYYVLTGAQMDSRALTCMDFSFLPAPNSEAQAIDEDFMIRQEEGKDHFDFAYEIEKMLQVTRGDVEAIRREITPDVVRQMSGRVGHLTEQPQKQWEYAAVTSIALSSRAAIRGGVPPAAAYSLSDVMMRKLSRCTDLPGYIGVLGEIRLNFAACVRDFQLQNSQQRAVEQAKMFLRLHLNKRVTLQEVADHVNLSPAYLCRKFKEAEGKSPMAYLQEKRIEAAAGMLLLTDDNIAYIAEYLCFHSQSHFGSLFKKTTGMSPKQYRDHHAV